MVLHFSAYLEHFSKGEETQGFFILEAGAPPCPGGLGAMATATREDPEKPSRSSPPSHECSKYFTLFAPQFLEILLELVNRIYLITIFTLPPKKCLWALFACYKYFIFVMNTWECAMLHFNESCQVALPWFLSLVLLLLRWSFHNTKSAASKWTVQWHLVRSQCCVCSLFFSCYFSKLWSHRQVFAEELLNIDIYSANICGAGFSKRGAWLSPVVGLKDEKEVTPSRLFLFLTIKDVQSGNT